MRNIEWLRKEKLIVFEGITGSQAYGISTPSSDVDKKGVFIQPLEDILRNGYVDQVSDEKNDTTFYEIKRFLELLATNNPNILELLNLPQDCVLHKDPIFDKVLSKNSKFVTKICKASFAGYAVQQIKKARGMNKKIVTPMDKQRKSVLDFCYVAEGQGSIPVKEWLAERSLDQKFCGLAAIPHMRYTYGLYYDKASDLTSKGVPLEFCPIGFYKGIVQDEETSNDISLSSIEKGAIPMCLMQFNKDGYSIYCKDYREYWDWVEKRNESRFSDNMLHGKGYDGKNLAHCHRLLDMAIEIAKGEGINVRRQNREELLSIRRGEYDYDKLLADAEQKIVQMDELYEKSSLPEAVDIEEVKDLLLEIRRERYKE